VHKEEKTMIKVKEPKEMPEAIGGVTAEERETIIRKDRVDGKAHICTTDCVEYRRLMRLCEKSPECWKAIGYETNGGQPQAAYFEAPARLVRYGSGKTAPLTAEQRAERVKRLQECTAAKKTREGKGE